MANPTLHNEASESLLPTGQQDLRPTTPTETFVRVWEAVFVVTVLGVVWNCFLSLYLQSEDMGHWPDAPHSRERENGVSFLLFLASAAVVLLTAGAASVLIYRIQSTFPHLKESDERGASISPYSLAVLGSLVAVMLAAILVHPDETCADGRREMQAIIRVPDTLTLPVTATVAFSSRTVCRACLPRFTLDNADSTTVLQFALAGSELGLTQETNDSFRILYDFRTGSAAASFLPIGTNVSTVVNASATFCNAEAEMRVALPPPRDRLFFVLDANGHTVQDASSFGGGESVIRVVNRRKGRVCLAAFDRNKVDEWARLAFPLGLIMHNARLQTPSSAWGIVRLSFFDRVLNKLDWF